MVVRVAFVAVLLLACGSGDEGIAADASQTPVHAMDSAVAAEFGQVSGDCEVLDSEIVSASPAYFRAAIEFDRLYTESDQDLLSAGLCRARCGRQSRHPGLCHRHQWSRRLHLLRWPL